VNMDVRRTWVTRERISREGGLDAARPVTRVGAGAVIANPLAFQAQDDIGILVPFGSALGDMLAVEALQFLSAPVVAYGKAALVGTGGDIEHGAAIIHPQMGKPMRASIGGGKALIPSNVKVAAAGAAIDIPLGHKDDPWSFDEIDTMTVMIAGAPRPDEIAVFLVFADGGRPRPRLPKAPAMPPATPGS
jgi:hypothetical protein